MEGKYQNISHCYLANLFALSTHFCFNNAKQSLQKKLKTSTICSDLMFEFPSSDNNFTTRGISIATLEYSENTNDLNNEITVNGN